MTACHHQVKHDQKAEKGWPTEREPPSAHPPDRCRIEGATIHFLLERVANPNLQDNDRQPANAGEHIERVGDDQPLSERVKPSLKYEQRAGQRLGNYRRRCEKEIGGHRRFGRKQRRSVITASPAHPKEKGDAQPRPEKDGRRNDMDRLKEGIGLHDRL